MSTYSFAKLIFCIEFFCMIGTTLRHIIVGGVRSWVQTGESSFSIPIHNYPTHMHEAIKTAIKQQNDIGWGNVLRGFFSKAWHDVSMLSYESTTLNQTEGYNMMRRLIQAVHTYTVDLWKARNEKLHDRENEEMKRIRSDNIAKICETYSQVQKLHFDDRYLCDQPLENILGSSVSTQRRWLRRVRESQKLHTQMGKRQTFMTSFFARRDNTSWNTTH